MQSTAGTCCRNISYPYGDSNRIEFTVASQSLRETLLTPMGTATLNYILISFVTRKHFIPLWGQQHIAPEVFNPTVLKHFLPLRGQQRDLRGQLLRNDRKHFIPLRGQQRIGLICVLPLKLVKYFIPLRGQQLIEVTLLTKCSGNISYPYGDSNPA